MNTTPLPALQTGNRRRGFSAVALTLALSAGSLLASMPAVAQQSTGTPLPLINEIRSTDGVAVAAVRPRSFNLFAQEDIAATSLRLTGSERFAFFNVGGLCPFANASGDLFNSACAQNNGTSTFLSSKAVWGVGPDAYAKILAVYPNVANMVQPVGFSTPWAFTSAAPIVTRINAADGQFGQLFSGATSEVGEGCRDFTGNSGANLPANITLTASSTCPETWSGTGFDGLREIPDSVWLQRFQANPAAFRWNDWQIPKALLGANPIGNNSTYGAFSDYSREEVQKYGGVTPRGIAGTPAIERGFPLGLYVRADAWKFDRPSLRNGVFVRWLVINNSEKVWDHPIDYDRIYFGMYTSYAMVGQAPAAYNIPKLGAHIASGGGWSGKCSTTFPRRTTPGANEACVGTKTAAPHAIMFLKSPLGDLRNKVFSDPTSPYYFPTHSKADDTITFNHFVKGGFGAQDAFSWRRSDRALLGLLSGDEQLWLDGRQYSDFSASQIWNLFRWEFTDGSQSAANLRYNKIAIGNISGQGKWDYNDDGIQDTLFLPDCGSLGCAGLWGDSIAGGYCQCDGSNSGTYLGTGPFALKAGDTTEYLFYMGGAVDTLGMNRLVSAVTTAYLKNYAGASAFPVPTFTAADVQLNSSWFRDSTAGNQTAEIRMQVKMAPKIDDPFIKTVLNRINATDAVAVNLRALNPTLVATVTGRMKQNLAQVLVFKSCDLGTSWTNDAACTSATAAFRTRNQDGTDIGLGWRPAFTLTADSITGVLSTNIVSDIVNSGREYLYSYVTKTRGLADISVVTSVTVSGGQTTVKTDNLQNVLGVDIDTLVSPLSASGPTTVRAYAPISVPAGTIYARLDTSRTQALQVTNRVATNQRNATADGVFRMRFGNRFILTRTQDTLTGAVTSSVVRQSTYARAATGPADAVTTTFIASADTFVSNHGITYSSPTAANCAGCQLRATPRSTTGNVQTFIDTLPFAGYVIARSSGGSDAVYLAVSTGASFTAITQNTTEYEGAVWYPGFTATVNGETALPGTRNIGTFANVVIRAPGDTLNSGVIGSTGVVYVSFTNSGTRGAQGGFYRLKWQDDAFGDGAPFRLAPRTEMQPGWDASIGSRAAAQFTDTSATYRAQLIAATGLGEGAANIGTRQLVRARVPFSVDGINGQPAKLVMLTRHTPGNAADSIFRNSRLVGSAGDTTRLAIPPDAWMPGDTTWIFENIITDSTVTIAGNVVQIVRDSVINGKHQNLPIQVTREVLGAKLAMQCAANGATPTRVTCNPLALGTRGATGYRPYANGYEQVLHFNRPFDQNAEVQLKATPIKPAALALSDRDMDQIHVVPNPFLVQSAYDQIASTRVSTNFVRFVNVPSDGLIRIYSISGQLMQQLSWNQSDLLATGNNSPHGDLPYNLRTKEGLDLSSGLYVYVLSATGANGNNKVKRGKFVVIR